MFIGPPKNIFLFDRNSEMTLARVIDSRVEFAKSRWLEDSKSGCRSQYAKKDAVIFCKKPEMENV